jgi:hypothetical protein
MIRTTDLDAIERRLLRSACAEGGPPRSEGERAGPSESQPPAGSAGGERRGGRTTRERMIRAALPELLEIARHYEHLGLPLLDLVQAGGIGLIRAGQALGSGEGATVSHDRSRWVEQSICRVLACQVPTFRFRGLGTGRNRTTVPAGNTKRNNPTAMEAATSRHLRRGRRTLR